jgi:hypothetical protein
MVVSIVLMLPSTTISVIYLTDDVIYFKYIYDSYEYIMNYHNVPIIAGSLV